MFFVEIAVLAIVAVVALGLPGIILWWAEQEDLKRRRRN